MRKQLLFTYLVILLFGLNSFIQVDEYALKIVFIERFTSFIEWPTTKQNRNSFTIGYFGKNEYGNSLNALKSKQIKGKKVEIRELKSVDEIKLCDLIIIMSQYDKKQVDLINSLKTCEALVICDNISPFKSYSSIYFKLENNTLQFSINERKLAEDDYVVSSKLLKLSKPNL